MTGEFETGISVSFHATHSLRGDFGPACEVHPHDYRLDVAVRGGVLSDEGILVDIVLIERAVRAITDHWDGQCLDALPELQGFNTTVETLAGYVHERVSAALLDRTDLTLEVKVWESAEVWGAYRGPSRTGSQRGT
jgi:6-pyruvoyltetrahydropterin/6-carboxytetrahydropterin synthase